jgi:hypothetical protein
MTEPQSNGGMTGWPPGMLQDDCRKLARWLANRIDSRRHAREAAAAIRSAALRNNVQGDERGD